MRGGDALDEAADVGERIGLDGGHEVGDVMEMRVERPPREPGALGHRRDRDARQVAGGLDLCGKRVAKARTAAKAATVEARGRDGCAGEHV